MKKEVRMHCGCERVLMATATEAHLAACSGALTKSSSTTETHAAEAKRIFLCQRLMPMQLYEVQRSALDVQQNESSQTGHIPQ